MKLRGLCCFQPNRKTRGLYSELFMHGKVEKTYQAIAEYTSTQQQAEWVVENRIINGEPWFRMKTAPGKHKFPFSNQPCGGKRKDGAVSSKAANR